MPRFEEEIQKAVEAKKISAVSLLVAGKGEILYRRFFGRTSLFEGGEPLDENHLFDIASLTKPVVIASLLLLEAKENGLRLDTPLRKYFEEFQEEEKNKITLRHLLKHTSGLPAWRPYYEEIRRESPDLWGHRECARIYLEKISQEPLEVPVTYQRIYSDLGFILLGIFLEKLKERPLTELFREKIAEPLDLKKTHYRPNETAQEQKSLYVATENSAFRGRLLQGEVHDNNAHALGGVAGHAGLFSTIDDLHRFLTEIAKGAEGGSPLFPREVLDLFIGPPVKIKLGWDTPSDKSSQAGSFFSRTSIGHLGYTGCSFWIDFEQKFHVILLTNRVHPSAENETLNSLRPLLHDLIYEELIRS